VPVCLRPGLGSYNGRMPRPFNPTLVCRLCGAAFVVLLGASAGPAALHARQSPATFRAVPLEEAGETTANASIGDLDRDGDPDIVLAKGRHWPLVELVFVNDGRGGFGERHDLGSTSDRGYTAARFGDGAGAVYGLAMGDLDADGTPDIDAARSGAASMIYFNPWRR
jgi:hypothetical protein